MRCISCNEELLPEATLCRFCGLFVNQPETVSQATTDNTQEAIPSGDYPEYPSPHRLDNPILSRLHLLFFVLFGLYTVFKLLTYSPQPEHNGEPIDLRGRNIITLRMPDSIAPSQRVSFYESGYVYRYNTPYNAATSQNTEIALNANEQRDLQIFRDQWCTSTRPIAQPTDGQPSYDIAVRCDDPHIKQAAISVEQLPPILHNILQRLPIPAH